MKRIRIALCAAVLFACGIPAFAQGGIGNFGQGRSSGGFGRGQIGTPGITRGGQTGTPGASRGGQTGTPGASRGGQQTRPPATNTPNTPNTQNTPNSQNTTTRPGTPNAQNTTTRPGTETTRPAASGSNGVPASAKRAFGAGQYDTAAFMAGEIYVNVVLFESNGRTDPDTENWSKDEIARVIDHVKKACAWWEEMWKRKNYIGTLHFTLGLDYANTPFQTVYEPVTHGAMRDDRLWICEFLNSLGYSGEKSRILYQYTNDLIAEHNADFAFSIFVVKADNDLDHYFADSYRSYAWGQMGTGCSDTYILTAYSKSYDWYSTQSFVHEMAHIFGALDEYPGQGRYTDIGGYYGVQNTNAPDGNPNRNRIVPSLMNGSVSAAVRDYTSSPQSFEMIGWRDSDGDRIIDVLDAPIDVTDLSSKLNLSGSSYEFSGTFTVQKVKNHNGMKAITINSVDRLLYRHGESGEWMQVNGKDWGEKSKTVSYQFELPKDSVLQWKVVDSSGTTESKTYTIGTIRRPTATILSRARVVRFSFTPATPDTGIIKYNLRVDNKVYDIGANRSHNVSGILNGRHTWALQGVYADGTATDWLSCGTFNMTAN